MKLELAILENLQREDLNAVDRARAFSDLRMNLNLLMLKSGQDGAISWNTFQFFAYFSFT